MHQQPGVQTSEHQEFPCKGCGAKLEFAPGTTSLECPYCGSAESIVAEQAKAVEEKCFDTALAELRRQPVSAIAQGGHEIQCNGCGAITVVTGRASACLFCGSPMVVPIEEDRATIVPEGVLPFAIDEHKAGSTFKEWVNSRWFAPNDLAGKARRARMDGVYLPYYTYDSATTSPYSGQRGTHYYVTETYSDSEGNTKTRQVRKTSWSSTSGTVFVAFDDILVCASKSLPDKIIAQLEPWDLAALTPYDPKFLSGFAAERAALDLQTGFGVAQGKMKPGIESAIRSDIGGDDQRISSYSTSHSAVTFKLFLLPLWISSFRYGDKIYRFVVNARTGEATGERPYSTIKIALAVIAGIVLLAGIVMLYTTYAD